MNSSQYISNQLIANVDSENEGYYQIIRNNSNNKIWLQKKEQMMNKSRIKSSKQLIISMSGFVHDPQTPTYLKYLQQIGCKHVQQLSHDVNYLIVNHTCTEKYKIAELSKSATQCITIKWLYDSVKNKKIMPFDKYKIKKIFYGVKVIMEGFDDKKMEEKIVELLKSNGAEEVKIGLQGMHTQQINEKYQLVLLPSLKIYKKLQQKVAQFLSIPLVNPEWLQQSIKNKKCKYPHDYSFNYHNLNTRLFDDQANIKRLKRKLQNLMQTDFLNTQISNLLYNQSTGEQCILYLDENSIEADFADLLKRLVCICGGLHLNTFGPVVTHILVGGIEQMQYMRFMSFGDSCQILRVQWLVDSMIFAQKLPEVDFKVRCFKNPGIKAINNLDIRDRFYFNKYSQTFINIYHNNTKTDINNYTASMPMFRKNKSISLPKQQQKITRILPKTRVNKSEILKGRYFYIEKQKKKQSYIMSIYNKIKQNGGFLINETTINNIKNKKLFVVLKDSNNNQCYLQSIHKLSTINNLQLIPISSRWIQQCVKKSQYIQYNAQNYFIFKPFVFDTPLRELMTMKIQLLGIDQILKRRYRELLIALGCNKISPNRAEITHCLCGSQYKNDIRYIEIMHAMEMGGKEKDRETTSKDSSGTKTTIQMLVNNNIKMVKIEWLIQMMKNKGKCNIDDYIINNST